MNRLAQITAELSGTADLEILERLVESARTSAESAETSKTNASTSETNAQTSANNASASEANALQYAQQAEQSKNSANNSALSASESASNASTSATNAQTSADNAYTSELNASTSEQNARNYAQQASASVAEIQGITASVTTLPEGSSATVSYANEHLSFGIPKGDTGAKGDKGDTGAKGDKGDTGNGIQSVTLTSTVGAVKTYTITFTDGTTTTFDVTDGEVTQTVLDEAITDLKSDFNHIAYEEVSKNLFDPSKRLANTYLNTNGTTEAYNPTAVTDYMPVIVGKYVTLSNYVVATGRTAYQPNLVLFYDNAKNIILGSGVTWTDHVLVPNGASYVRVCYGNAITDLQVELTDDGVFTSYEAYTEPSWHLDEDIIIPASQVEGIPTEVEYITPKGYNLLPNATKDEGHYYYANGSTITKGTDASYTAFIVNAKEDTDYYFTSNSGARFWIVTDGNDTVVKSGSFLNSNESINTGNGTKIWLSCYTTDYNANVLSLVEGFCGSRNGLQKPSFLNEVSLLLQGNKYACSLPRNEIRMTQGIDETFYFENMVSLNPKLLNIYLGLGSSGTMKMIDGGVEVDTTNVVSSVNGYRANIYDHGLNMIDNITLKPFNIKARNLQNCSALVIGDSQVEQGFMTQDMLDAFTEDNKVLTLLGTRGTAPNLTEGRSGWGANTYCTQASSGGVTNAFWNPSTSKFDFGYYMNQQGYESVDFVIINLGGNDLYDTAVTNEEKIAQTVDYMLEIINSILSFNSSQKIILNLAPATTSKMEDAIEMPWKVKNVYTRYNNIMQVVTLKKVRTSYTHLIVNPSTDLRDHIHENEGGYKKMADELINQINCWQNA